jgi:hypothetical protein
LTDVVFNVVKTGRKLFEKLEVWIPKRDKAVLAIAVLKKKSST